MIYVFLLILGFVVGCVFMYGLLSSFLKKAEVRLNKNKTNLDVVNQWLILKQLGVDLAKEISKYNIQRIGIYGMGICGRHLIRELADSNVKVVNAFDQKKMKPYQNIKIQKLTGKISGIDAVINTVFNDTQLVNDFLKSHCDCPVISLEDIIFNCDLTSETGDL